MQNMFQYACSVLAVRIVRRRVVSSQWKNELSTARAQAARGA